MRGHPLLAQLPQPRSTFADGGAVSGKNLLQGQGQRAADVVVLVGEQELRCLYPIDVGGQVFNNCQFVQEYPTLAQHYLSSRAGSRRFCAYEPEAEA